MIRFIEVRLGDNGPVIEPGDDCKMSQCLYNEMYPWASEIEGNTKKKFRRLTDNIATALTAAGRDSAYSNALLTSFYQLLEYAYRTACRGVKDVGKMIAPSGNIDSSRLPCQDVLCDPNSSASERRWCRAQMAIVKAQFQEDALKVEQQADQIQAELNSSAVSSGSFAQVLTPETVGTLLASLLAAKLRAAGIIAKGILVATKDIPGLAFVTGGLASLIALVSQQAQAGQIESLLTDQEKQDNIFKQLVQQNCDGAVSALNAALSNALSNNVQCGTLGQLYSDLQAALQASSAFGVNCASLQTGTSSIQDQITRQCGSLPT